jgi:hypothetical protein
LELGALSSGVKWPGREADHSPPTSANTKKVCSFHPPPLRLHWHKTKLVKHSENINPHLRPPARTPFKNSTVMSGSYTIMPTTICPRN